MAGESNAPDFSDFGGGFDPGIAKREVNGPGPDLGVYIVVPNLPGRQDDFPPVGESIIRFVDQPAIVETRQARYTPENLLHSPEGFHAYEGTDSRQFDIEGKFFCSIEAEIGVNNQILQIMRSLVMPDYNKTGAPPTPVKLFAYGTKNIHALPCLVRSYTMNYPNDVDYVVDRGNPDITMPVVFTLGISLIEQHSISQLRQFTLDDFRVGAMVAKGF